MDNKNLDNTEKSRNQVLISYELLCLLKHVITHESTKLKKLVNEMFTSNAKLKQELSRIETNKEIPTLEETQQIIIEFFGLLELLLIDSIAEQALQHAHEKELMPVIRHIDAQACSKETIQSTVEKITQIPEEHSTAHMQHLLLKELLKNWKPQKKEMN